MKTLENLETDGSQKEQRRNSEQEYLYKEYEKYLDKFTMRVSKDDFFYPQDLPSMVSSLADLGLDDDDVPDKNLQAKLLETYITSKKESSEKEEGEIKSAGRPQAETLSPDFNEVASSTTQGGEEQRTPMFLQFLEKKLDEDRHTQRVIVDAQCGICLINVLEGDEIVWSRLECRHIFHRKCILPRLASEKKRCPICRHFFASGVGASSQTSMIYRFDPPGVLIHLISTFGSIENSFRARMYPTRDSTERKDYVLVRGEGFFFYPPGKWVIGRCNSKDYSFAYACVSPPGETYEDKVWLQVKK